MAIIDVDPDSYLDYAWDWTDWLVQDEEVINFLITPTPEELIDTIDQKAITSDATGVVAWIRVVPDSANTAIQVTCHIRTNQGREDDRTHHLWVKER